LGLFKQKDCSIKKNLTNHVAIYTVASTITLSRGGPIEFVFKMPGHANLTITQIYTQVTDMKVAYNMRHYIFDI
jgi:site-specific recombinase XerD